MPVRLSSCSSSCVSLRQLLEEFRAFLARAVHTWKYGVSFPWVLYLAVSCSVFGCVACRVRKIGSSSYVHNAWFGSENVFYISTDAFGEVSRIFHGRGNSNPEVLGLRSPAEWRNVLSRCLRCLEIGHFMYELHVAGKGA